MFLVGALAALVSACGGGGKSNATPTVERLAPDVLLTPGPNETPGHIVLIPSGSAAVPSTPGAQPTASTSAAATLIDLVNAGVNATYKATYAATPPQGDTSTPEAGTGGNYTVFNRPPLTRIDNNAPDGAQPESIVIARNGTGQVVSCSGAPNWQCQEVAQFGRPAVASLGPVVLPEPADLNGSMVTESAPRTIAGQVTRCFDVTPPDASKKLTYCFDGEGVPLYSESITGAVEAISISGDVTEADFKLPG